ncbi:MAG: hypothetical protein F6K04_12455 [Leptolyngbya sp. SIO4C5]|uniref:hypothetical protein n=1 Tax=Sphaerothrix gracilis TaxID=3151835 RepID=UPI0013C1683E|nr:hypothetical protein [Leptolyngbya sp. SIO4C5]
MFDRWQTSLAESWQHLNQSVTTLKSSAAETAERATDAVSNFSNQAGEVVETVTDQAAAAVNEAASAAGEGWGEATRSLTATAEQTKTSLQEMTQADPIGGFTGGFQGAIAASTQTWLSQHPVIAWMVTHPLLALGLAVVVLLSLWGFLGAIAQFVRQVWVGILSLPLRLMQWLLLGVFRLFRRADALQRLKKGQPPELQPRLLEILSRLESLQQEQAALMREMQAILAAKGIESAKTH